jgi:hypothetical protein
MIVRVSQSLSPRGAAMALLVLGLTLAGCANMNDTMLSAFADPAQFDLFDCKQLESTRIAQTTRAAELEGLMAKADTGVAGPVVAELAYRNEYISVRAQARLADQAWRRNKCRPSTPATGAPAAPPAPPPDARAPAPPSRSGSAVY